MEHFALILLPHAENRQSRQLIALAEALPVRPTINGFNPVTTLVINFEKEVGLVLIFTAIAFAAYCAVRSYVPSQFAEIYGYHDIHIGLCFIPVGIGSLIAIFTQGKMVDCNYRRHAKRSGFPLVKTTQTDLSKLPIEVTRLELSLPMLVIQVASRITYGWVIQFEANLADPLIHLFIMTYSAAAAFTVMTTLVLDLYLESLATASAANNLTRCWLGSGATVAIIPMINTMGRGWSCTFSGLLGFASCPILLAVMRWGPGWREQRRIRLEEKDAAGKH